MGKNRSIAKKRKDKYYNLAHKEGYRARSAYKVSQLNKKYGFLGRATCVVDLCAAPGGWLQVCQQVMPVTAKIIGVDLYPIKYIPGVKTIIGDITTEKCRKEILRELQNKKCDVVLHDGAPPVGGTWDKDAYIQNCLVLHATRLACNILVAQGTFVTKVFRSVDYTKLIFVFKELFEKVEATKPPSSRGTSAEIFVVCRGYKNPKSISPSFFNPSDVFAEIVPSDEVVAKKIKLTDKPRNDQSGYDEWKAYGGETLFATMSAHDFVLKENNPEAVLERYNKITFDDEASKPFKDSKFTTEDIIYICEDLRARGKFDKGRVLKWKKKVWEEFKRNKNQSGEGVGDEGAEEMEEDPEEEPEREVASGDEADIEDIKKEMDEIQKIKQKERLKRQKKTIDKKLKMAARSGFNPDDNPMDVVDDQHGDLFRYEGTPGDVEVNPDEVDDGLSSDGGEIGVLSDGEGEEGEEDEEGEEYEEKDYFSRLEDIFEDEHQKRIAHLPYREEKAEVVIPEDDGAETTLRPDIKDSDDESESSSSCSEDYEMPKKRQKTGNNDDPKPSTAHKKIGFETVPKMLRDPVHRSKVLAIGSAMLNREKRRDIIEAGYNRYAFNDTNLPKWFKDDEKKHSFVQIPVTKEQVELEKTKQMEISARPAKRVLEAMHRNRVRAAAQVKKLVQKAQGEGDHFLKNVPSVRKVLRTQQFKTRKQKKQYLDTKMLGEKKRERQRLAKQGRKNGKKR